MSKGFTALLLSFITIVPVAGAVTLEEVGAKLAAAGCYCADVEFSVWLPNASDPVVYHNKLQSMAAPGDTLAPCAYVIDWAVPTPKGESKGFSSYYAGDHFRYREGRLQEYHFADNPMPFAPRGYAADGVQQRAQFADLLPQFIGEKLVKMAGDSSFVYEMSEYPGGELRIKGVERIHGYDGTEFEYILDSQTYMPRKIELTTNPGQIGEQILSVEYAQKADCDCTEPDEDYLIKRYPEEFAKFRHDSFSLQSLPGKRMPSFTAPTPTRERYSYQSGDDFAAPTVIAVLDAEVASTPEVIESLRQAIDALPGTANLILAFTGNDSDAAEAATGWQMRPGEAVLVSARSLARDCGVADTPSIIICRRDGTVSDVVIGRNNDLRSVVIQKTALAF